MNINEIINQYTNGEADLEQTNAALEEAGAGFQLAPREESGWTRAEMKEGFTAGEPSEVLPDRPVMARRKDLAGQIVRQHTKAGQYDVYYDIDGYCIKASKV